MKYSDKCKNWNIVPGVKWQPLTEKEAILESKVSVASVIFQMSQNKTSTEIFLMLNRESYYSNDWTYFSCSFISAISD